MKTTGLEDKNLHKIRSRRDRTVDLVLYLGFVLKNLAAMIFTPLLHSTVGGEKWIKQKKRKVGQGGGGVQITDP